MSDPVASLRVWILRWFAAQGGCLRTGSSDRSMRKREREIIVSRIDEVQEDKPGEPICIRPFDSDDKKLNEIVNETGEVKSSIVRKMIRFALTDKRVNFTSNPCQGKLDWLVKHGRKSDDISSQIGSRLDEILERVEALEDEVKVLAENSRAVPTFLRELYCLASILVSSQNLTLTRLLEFSSPSPKERDQAVLIAAAARANQIGEAAEDLSQFAAFHDIPLGDDSAHELYLLTKVKAIKDKLASSSSSTSKPPNTVE